jgi:hypothetical protein
MDNLNDKLPFEYETQPSCSGAVSTRTFHFSDWVDGNLVDETFKAIDREDAVKIMKVKYPNHDFQYARELF